MDESTRLKKLEEQNRELKAAVDELKLLNELATEIAGQQDIDEMLKLITRTAIRALSAEQGVITLIDSGKGDELRTVVRTSLRSGSREAFSPDSSLLGWMQVHRQPVHIDTSEGDDRFPYARWDPSIRSILSVPLVTQAKMIGVLSLYNKAGMDRFPGEDVRILTIVAAQSAQILANTLLAEERSRVIQLFGQHTAPTIVEQLMRADAETDGARRFVCVMFLDVRDFTSFAERRMPEEVVAFLNQFFEIVIEVISEHSGIVHQLLGDGLMAIFGAPISQGNDCANAIDAARKIVARVQHACDAGTLPQTRIGIGLHAGEVVAGSVGTSIHKEYKVTGDAVNLAARIESLTKSYGVTVLASETVVSRAGTAVEAHRKLGATEVRGRTEGVTLFEIT